MKSIMSEKLPPPVDFKEALILLEQKLRYCEDSVSLIDGLLEGTAQYYGADRAYIIEADWELGIGLNTYEWCQPGVEHQKDMLQFMTMEVFPRWKRFLIENKPIIIPDTEELKAEYPDEYDFFTKYGVRSLLCAPYSKRINQGYVGVDNPTRFQNDPTFLFIMCYAIVLELNEIKMQQSVEAAERKASRYNDNEVYINTFGGLEIITNKGTLTDDDIKSDQCYNFLCFMLLNHKRRYPIENLYDVIRPYDVKSDNNPYYVVKNVVYRTRRTLSIISFGHVGSLFFNYDLLGYGMMALSTFFLGLTIRADNSADKWLRRLMLIHGIFFLSCFIMPMTGMFQSADTDCNRSFQQIDGSTTQRVNSYASTEFDNRQYMGNINYNCWCS